MKILKYPHGISTYFPCEHCIDELMSMVQVEQVKYFLHEYSLFHPL